MHITVDALSMLLISQKCGYRQILKPQKTELAREWSQIGQELCSTVFLTDCEEAEVCIHSSLHIYWRLKEEPTIQVPQTAMWLFHKSLVLTPQHFWRVSITCVLKIRHSLAGRPVTSVHLMGFLSKERLSCETVFVCINHRMAHKSRFPEVSTFTSNTKHIPHIELQCSMNTDDY